VTVAPAPVRAPSPRLWSPPRLAVPDLGLWNALHAPRGAAAEGAVPDLRCDPGAIARLRAERCVTADFALDGEAGRAWLSLRAAGDAARAAGLGQAPASGTAMRVLLAVLAEEAGAPPGFDLRALAPGAGPPPAALGLELRVGGQSLPLALEAGPATLGALLDRLAPTVRPAPPDIRLPVRILIGRARLSAADLARLEPGGALVPPVPLGPLEAVVEVGATHTARAFRRSTSVMLMEGLRMADPTPPDAAPDGSLDDVGVEVVFEIDRQTLPLGRLRDLAAGQILPLSHGGRRPTVALVAGDRRIATASLVTLGDTVALRIDRMAGR
jgi:type III secretion system YscQ/HrcQ family protein